MCIGRVDIILFRIAISIIITISAMAITFAGCPPEGLLGCRHCRSQDRAVLMLI